MQTIIYPVDDLARAKPLYTALIGVEPHTDAPYYVGYRLGDQEIGLDPNGHGRGLTGPVGYWEVTDMEAAVQRIVAAGGTVRQDARDVGGGKLIGLVADADGNVIGLSQTP